MQATHASKVTPQELESLYTSVRNYTEEICEPLETEDYILQPTVDVSPAKWNIAHTTWFFEEMILKKFAPDYQEFDQQFGYLFNSYYNSVGERTVRDRRGDLSRPTVRRVFEYRQYVDEKMREFLRQDLSEEIRELLVLGLNHEQQHQELLITDLKYTFSVNPTFPVYKEGFALVEKGEIEPNGFAEIEGGIYEIGFQGEGFHLTTNSADTKFISMIFW